MGAYKGRTNVRKRAARTKKAARIQEKKLTSKTTGADKK